MCSHRLPAQKVPRRTLMLASVSEVFNRHRFSSKRVQRWCFHRAVNTTKYYNVKTNQTDFTVVPRAISSLALFVVYCIYTYYANKYIYNIYTYNAIIILLCVRVRKVGRKYERTNEGMTSKYVN